MSSKLLNFFYLKSSQKCFQRMYSEGLPENLRRNYEKFQKDDGVPVYIKNGLPDRILLGITVIAVGIGLIESARTFYKLHKKK